MANNMTFAVKDSGLINSSLIVYDNVVSGMIPYLNADLAGNNIETNEQILINPFVDPDDANYNLDTSKGGSVALNIVSSIFGTSSINYDIPRLLEEDLYRKKRSQLQEGGLDSADAGAIEYNYLNDSRSYPDASMDSIAALTPQGRNLVARSTMGMASCKITGFYIGRGGYTFHNPVNVLPLSTISDVARGWIEILSNNSWAVTDVIQIQGYLGYKTNFYPRTSSQVDDPSTHSYYFEIGVDDIETAQYISDKINENSELIDTVYAYSEGIRVFIVSVPFGTIGNTIWYGIDSPRLSSYYGLYTSEGMLIGGVDENVNSLIDKVFEGTVDGGEVFVELVNETSLGVTVKLGPTDNNWAIGEVAIIAEINQSTFLGEIGTKFIFALGHQPISVKHSQSIFVKRFVILL